ncbi:MAG: hypothetical protein EAZ08_02475 [Cytophagales bacterium]|nr:MAG: hypothetical protein EAZ08_02475 [Cytophagales bacterium]
MNNFNRLLILFTLITTFAIYQTPDWYGSDYSKIADKVIFLCLVANLFIVFVRNTFFIENQILKISFYIQLFCIFIYFTSGIEHLEEPINVYSLRVNFLFNYNFKINKNDSDLFYVFNFFSVISFFTIQIVIVLYQITHFLFGTKVK